MDALVEDANTDYLPLYADVDEDGGSDERLGISASVKALSAHARLAWIDAEMAEDPDPAEALGFSRVLKRQPLLDRRGRRGTFARLRSTTRGRVWRGVRGGPRTMHHRRLGWRACRSRLALALYSGLALVPCTIPLPSAQ